MQVINNHRNDLLKRREMLIEIESASNPGIPESKKIIAKLGDSTEDSVTIKKITSKFGRKTFTIEANVYDSPDKMNDIEPKPKVKKEKKN